MQVSFSSKVLLSTAAFSVLTACQFDTSPPGPLRETSVNIDRGNAERAQVDLDMGAGEMTVSGGANELVQGRFSFNVPSWEPKVDSTKSGSRAIVRIMQPNKHHMGGNRQYKWDLQLNNDVLLDLAANCGAGRATLDLGELALRHVQVHMGAGEVNLDLRGTPEHDYEVEIAGGVGQATVHLPRGVGIWAEARGGLGSINVTGLEKQDNHWQNDLYDKEKVNVRIKVEGGIGEIRLIG